VNTARSKIAGLPSVLRLAGERLRVCYSFATPPRLPEHAILLRRTKDRTGRIASRYWQTSRQGCHRLLWPDTGTFDLDARSDL